MQNIKKVKGTIESHGIGHSLQNSSISTNVVIKTENGELKKYKLLGGIGIVGNYISTGVSGEFHIVEFKNFNIIVAIQQSDGTKVSDIDAYKEEYKKCKSINGGGNFLMFLGILTIPLLLFGLIVMFKAAEIKSQAKPFLANNPDEIEQYLISEGIITS